MTVFERANHLGIQPATQSNSASYPAREMSTGQGAVMLYGWGAMAHSMHLWINVWLSGKTV